MDENGELDNEAMDGVNEQSDSETRPLFDDQSGDEGAAIEGKITENQSIDRNGQASSSTLVEKNDQLPKGRGLTGYMLFLKQNRSAFKEELGEGKNGLKEVSRFAAEKWKTLSTEEKAKWNIEARSVKPTSKANKSDISTEPNDEKFVTPISRVREIMKKDPEVKAVNAHALRLLTKATDLFIKDLIQMSFDCGDRKKLRQVDVHHIIHGNDERFGFLVYDFESPAEIADREQQLRKKKLKTNEEKKQQQSQEGEMLGNKLINSYFSKA